MSMFIKNKYYKIYIAIIERAKNRTIDEYCEKHHIIPKALGGSNDRSNLVHLTAREHFICHRLLIKITQGKDKEAMCFAANRMTTSRNADYNITSYAYQSIRKQFAETLKTRFLGQKNPMFGKLNTDRSKKVTFNNIEFPNFSRLCEYANLHYGLTRFVMKTYRKRYPNSKTFDEYIQILKENNERSRLAGKNNKGKSSPFVGVPNEYRCRDAKSSHRLT